jgi:hypothetical protein
MPDQTFDTNPPADRIAEIRARHDSGQLLRRNDFEWLLSEHDRLTSDLTEERAEHFETKEAYAQTSNAGVTYLTRIEKLTTERDAALGRVEELERQLAAAASAIREKHRPLSNGGFSSRKTFVCDGHESWLDWPCSEARRVYAEEEIQRVLGGADDER